MRCTKYEVQKLYILNYRLNFYLIKKYLDIAWWNKLMPDVHIVESTACRQCRICGLQNLSTKQTGKNFRSLCLNSFVLSRQGVYIPGLEVTSLQAHHVSWGKPLLVVSRRTEVAQENHFQTWIISFGVSLNFHRGLAGESWSLLWSCGSRPGNCHCTKKTFVEKFLSRIRSMTVFNKKSLTISGMDAHKERLTWASCRCAYFLNRELEFAID